MDLQARRDARSLDHGTLEEMRRLAVRRVKAGETQRSVAESLEIHPRTVSKWVVTERRAGAEALASRKSSGRPPGLTAVENAMTGIALDRDLVRRFFDHPDVAYVKAALHW